jgi:glycosyltransferase involved in cell wall biosynthesis
VTRLHSYELLDWGPKINWDAVDKIILVSEAMRRRFYDLYPSQVSKTEVVYNGINLDKFKFIEPRNFHFNLGMLCNINPIKRVYEVVIVFAKLKQLGYDLNLYIAGKPGYDLRYFAAINDLIDQMNLRTNVHIHGYVEDTSAWLQNIDILISNSYWEGQPVSLLEGMASGCYCLSHKWGGAEEILPSENLFFSDEELEHKIIEFYTSSESSRHESQAKMRAIAVMNFDIEQTKLKIRTIINQAGSK